MVATKKPRLTKRCKQGFFVSAAERTLTESALPKPLGGAYGKGMVTFTVRTTPLDVARAVKLPFVS